MMIFNLIDAHTSDAGIIAGLAIAYILAQWRLTDGV